ncbi:MAG: hypothetical protein WAO08_35370 [Hyphomicrobiaceae bacterium]
MRTFAFKTTIDIVVRVRLRTWIARSWGKRLIWTWPRYGRRETLEGAGISLAKQYTAAGLTMTRTHANMDDGTPGGSLSVEAGLMDMLDRMQSGKFKVYNHLAIGSRSSGCTTARTARL